MSLFNPESGLIIWMLLAFGIVFAVLAKFGVPIITDMVDKRKRYIDESLEAAREANQRIVHIKEESERLLAETREQQADIIREAMETRGRIIDEAKEKALSEGNRLLEEARCQIQKEKEDAIRDIRHHVATLSVEIAEKILRKQLNDEEKQNGMIDRLLAEATDKKR